jgi:hypothetical protein
VQKQKFMLNKTRAKFVEAVGYSGNPALYAKLEAVAADKNFSAEVRSQARSSLKEKNRYIEIAKVMNVGVDQAKDVAQLWAIRHKNGLAVGESVRFRWAARDLYLHGYGRESLDVALEVLRANVADPLTDRYREDGIAFLCKALGLSGIADYKQPLMDIANGAVNDKYARYAERAAQYFDAGFKSTNKAGKYEVPAQSRRP